MTSPLQLRALVRDALPLDPNEYGSEPPLHQFFVPKSHARALHLNIPIVVGSRGAGKSFWWGVLQSRRHRAVIERLAPDTRIKASTIVAAGYGSRPAPDRYPNAYRLEQLLEEGFTPREIWKTVMLWAIVPRANLPAVEPWSERLSWARRNSESADRLILERDRLLVADQTDLIVVFDALEWTASDWGVIMSMVEGLLKVALEFRAYRRIRAKVFLRTDQFDIERVARFPDASKLIASKVELRWLTTELYGLLWQLLAHHPEKGQDFRQVVDEVVGRTSPAPWELPRQANFDVKLQERIFHHLTGPYMGTGPRRGFPYKWLPSHLADAHGELTPRSFLVSLRAAAEDSIQNHIGWGHALHYRSLHAGVQAASSIRVVEISEHGWVPEVMRDLKEQVLVPFSMEDLEACWERAGSLARLREQREAEGELGGMDADDKQPWLLPPSLDAGAAGVRDDLAVLGVFRKMRDGRIDVPDVYRLGFGLRRKGGVAPMARGR